MTDKPAPRQPQNLERTADERLSVSDRVDRTLNLGRAASDRVEVSDSVETRVAQAQALIATAVGAAHDASVRIEKFAATVTTDADRESVAELRDDVASIRSTLQTMDQTVNGIRDAIERGGAAAARFNWTQVVIGIGGIVIGIIVALLLR